MTWVRCDADKARAIVIGLREPVPRIRLVNLACSQDLDKVFSMIDSGKAGVNDFAPYVRALLVASPAFCADAAVWCLQGQWTPAGWTCMFWAVCCTNAVDVIDELVRRGAAVNTIDQHFRTPLHHAAIKGSMDAVQRLVYHGADVNAADEARCTLARRAPPHSLCVLRAPH